jgi:hypothetical protein
MSGEHEIDKSFPYFEEHNFQVGSSNLRPCVKNIIVMKLLRLQFQKDVNENGNPIRMNAREWQDSNRDENSGPTKKKTRLSTQGSLRPVD